uniref:TLC domain-containing protein n=1 Tax=Kalanchoe fedtschenkoi TaxID=63787 RepID=A0A7N0TLD6_KALFE
MAVSKQAVMAIKSYQNQAHVWVNHYLLADPFIPYTSILAGIFAFKMIYDVTQLISTFYFKTYSTLTKVQRMEWNNRGISTVHAMFIAALALYFVFWSDLFSDKNHLGPLTFRNSHLSTFGLGVSVGYFLSDIAMILWLYPSIGGIEYVIHHSLSGIAVAYAMFTGEGQLYTYMVLISEVTTPEINMRWYLDISGMKRSGAYLLNGIVIFFTWLVARILLFVYMFYHVYLHMEQVNRMHIFGFLLVFVVPAVLGVMNLMWFGKILRGLRKTLAKRQ